jgi:hypothetical protein
MTKPPDGSGFPDLRRLYPRKYSDFDNLQLNTNMKSKKA